MHSVALKNYFYLYFIEVAMLQMSTSWTDDDADECWALSCGYWILYIGCRLFLFLFGSPCFVVLCEIDWQQFFPLFPFATSWIQSFSSCQSGASQHV